MSIINVIYLYEQGHPHQDISEKLGMKLQEVRGVISRAVGLDLTLYQRHKGYETSATKKPRLPERGLERYVPPTE